MKLIIEIDEDYYKSICNRAERFGRGSAILPKSEKIIFNGTPLSEELEKIKAEINEQIDFNESCCERTDLHEAIGIINRHIAELKGEQK